MIKWAKIKEDHPLGFAMFIIPLLPPQHKDKYQSFRVQQVHGSQFLELKVLNLRAALPGPRMLYDFFDNCRVFVSTTYVSFEIVQVSEDGALIERKVEGGFKNRHEAETHAFIEAFALLEKEIMKHNDQKEPESPLKIV